MISSVRRAALAVARAGYRAAGRLSFGKIPGARRLADVGLRLLWPHPTVIEIEGSRMHIDPTHPNPTLRRTFLAYALQRTHEPATTALFRHVVHPGDVVVDLGANMGYFTLLAARLVGPRGRVFSFEPEPTNFSVLTRNIRANGYDHVTAYQKAVADGYGSTKLFICTYDSGHHTINQFDGIAAYAHGRTARTEWIDIDTVPLDDFLGEEGLRVGVIKMDIEGAEALALAGMRRLMAQNKNLRVFAEFFPLLLTKMGSSPEEYARQLIHEFGLTVYAVGHDYTMARAAGALVPLRSVPDLLGLIDAEDDHVNLFLVRE